VVTGVATLSDARADDDADGAHPVSAERSRPRPFTRSDPRTTRFAGRSAVAGLRAVTRIVPYDVHAFSADVAVISYEDLMLARIRMGAARVRRTSESVDRSPVGSQLVIVLDGELVLTQGGERRTVGAGGIALLSGYKEWSSTSAGAIDVALIVLSRGALLASGVADYRGGVQALPASALGEATAAVVRSFDAGLPRTDAASGVALQRVLRALASGVIAEWRGPVAVRAEPAAGWGAIIDEIERNSRDPQLSVEVVARRLSFSTRHVQRILADGGTTFGGLLRRRRVRDAGSLLEDAELGALGIAEVGALVGFANPAAMRRAFVAERGVTPSRYRAELSAELVSSSAAV
jgi:AraC-like DNA-binding protein